MYDYVSKYECIYVSGPRLLPPLYSPPWPFPGLSAAPVSGIELVGAAILVTLLVFGGWDRH